MSTPPKLNTQGLPEGYQFNPDWEVTPRQVKTMLDQREDFVLVDCRTAGEHQVASIAGARLVPMQEIGSRLGELEAVRDKPIVIHCHHGARSLRVTAFLRQQGFADVKSMAGGIDVWAMDIDTAMKRY